ncbi:hypothetical protein ATSB10_35280 [Dyella thiooxydans]|uniref:Uncharacterized protein n=1 Tax=Dyella thiooxydans TaxID=445710 RepID=A0A160N5T4_9GAMM|nr:hypothetical protein ATSB10_35280 [Dyella thiooxydans]
MSRPRGRVAPDLVCHGSVRRGGSGILRWRQDALARPGHGSCSGRCG